MSELKNLKQWFDRAELDFFGPFLSLFFSFNGWYKYYCSSASLSKDRDCIEYIKKDDSLLFEIFLERFYNISKQIPLLYFSLKEAGIIHNKKEISLSSIVKYERTIDNIPEEKRTPEVVLSYLLELDSVPDEYKDPSVPGSIRLGDIYVVDDKFFLYKEIIEIIYKVRCALVHGDLVTNTKTNEVMKYSYFILQDLLKPIFY